MLKAPLPGLRVIHLYPQIFLGCFKILEPVFFFQIFTIEHGGFLSIFPSSMASTSHSEEFKAPCSSWFTSWWFLFWQTHFFCFFHQLIHAFIHVFIYEWFSHRKNVFLDLPRCALAPASDRNFEAYQCSDTCTVVNDPIFPRAVDDEISRSIYCFLWVWY